jgi:endonuclease/exonuclease/phosphatase family metal-dependent hydrolase
MQNGQPWIENDPFPSIVDLDAVATFLKGLNADIICLQEVERGHAVDGTSDWI